MKHPAIGMATVDFKERIFRPGISTFGRAQGPDAKPSGRGWEQKLVDAAMAWLESTL